MKYFCTTQDFDDSIIEADSFNDAIEKYIDEIKDQYSSDESWFVRVTASLANQPEEYEGGTFIVNPEEPACIATEHDFQSPYELVGGCKENPGCWGNGGGVKYVSLCMLCGLKKVENTWDHNPDTGEEGFESVKYSMEYHNQVAVEEWNEENLSI